MAVARIETGIAVSEITVVRQFSRNANSTTATTTPASSSTRSTFRIDVSMKLAWRNTNLVGLDALRQRRRDLLQRPLDLAGQPDRIDIGLLLDRDDDGRLAHVAGFAALHLGRELDRRDLAQKHRPAIRPAPRPRCAGRPDWWCGRYSGSDIRANAGR